jgi:hypothetical protein
MKKSILFFYFCFSIINITAQQISISDSAIISLISCSPGKEVYAKFGHTALRVNDKTNGIDLVFNYGIFSFETKNFYYKFIKGQLDYQLGVYDTKFFLPEYAARNSMVVEQILNLTPDERNKLIHYLTENYEPQNRIYRYNFVYDNCSSRPRDKIISALNGHIKFQTVAESNTFRQWIGKYVGIDTWLKFGIDLIFGMEADKIASQNESMFLPEILMFEMQSAQIISANGNSRKLVAKRNILVEAKEEKEPPTSWFQKPIGFSIFLLLLGSIITLWDLKRKRHYKKFDSVILFISGLAGVIIFYMMAFSEHPLVTQNLNLLWLNPLNLFVAVVLWVRPLRKILFYYQILNLILLIGALFAFALSSQVFNIANFPLIVLLLIRSSHWFWRAKRRVFKGRDFFQKK